MRDDAKFPGLYRRQLGRGVSWMFYKHWGQSCWAGEGLAIVNGDRSGCVKRISGMDYTNVPSVVQARLYESERGSISAVYSYPNGIGLCPHYFWEIYDSVLAPDYERFSDEQAMERRIVELLGDEGAQAMTRSAEDAQRVADALNLAADLALYIYQPRYPSGDWDAFACRMCRGAGRTSDAIDHAEGCLVKRAQEAMRVE